MIKKILGRGALVLFGVFWAFIMVEAGFRLLDLGKDSFSTPHPVLGAFHPPGKTGIYSRSNFKVKISINSQGLRDVEHSPAKSAGTYRIVVLGDSFMEAIQVPLEQTFAKQLEQMLNADSGGKKYEVINLGMAGFGTDQEYLALKHLGLQYQPDLVILAFFPGNDVRDNYFFKNKPHFRLDAGGKPVLQPFTYQPTSKTMTLLQKSRVITTLLYFTAESKRINQLKAKWKKFFGGSGPADNPRHTAKKQEVFALNYTDDWQKAWELTLALINETQKLSSEHGAQFLLMSLTSREQLWGPGARKEFLDKGYDLERPEMILSDFCRKKNINYMPLLYPFREYMEKLQLSKKDFHIVGDEHWTAPGHQLAAKLVKERIEQGRPEIRGKG